MSQTSIIKKSFMNYANLIIEKKNIEKNEIKKHYENKFMSMAVHSLHHAWVLS